MRTSGRFRLAFVLGEQTSQIKIKSLRTGTRNLKIQDGDDVDVLRRPVYDLKLLKVPASAIMTSSVLNIMLSLVTYLAVFILKIIESTRDIGRALNNLFLIFPQIRFQKYNYIAHFSLAISHWATHVILFVLFGKH